MVHILSCSAAERHRSCDTYSCISPGRHGRGVDSAQRTPPPRDHVGPDKGRIQPTMGHDQPSTRLVRYWTVPGHSQVALGLHICPVLGWIDDSRRGRLGMGLPGLGR